MMAKMDLQVSRKKKRDGLTNDKAMQIAKCPKQTNRHLAFKNNNNNNKLQLIYFQQF